MLKRVFCGIMLIQLLTAMLMFAFNVQHVKAMPEFAIIGGTADCKSPIIASSSRYFIPEVKLVPEQPYPSDEVNVIISFSASHITIPKYKVVQEENTFDIYVTWDRSPLPVHKHYVLNVSLGQLPIGPYQVNVKGMPPQTITFVVDSVHTISHIVEVYAYPFRIVTESNSTISAFNVNLEEKQISFNVSGQDGTIGFCNIIVPKLLLYGDFLVLIDDSPITYTLAQNSTHSFLYFVYTHSMHTAKIAGTVIAESPLPKVFRVPDVNPTIQEAVDTANPGDTIRVRAGTYYENLLVDKTVSLVGENQATTIIDGQWLVGVIIVIAQGVTISGFTVENGWFEGVFIGANGCNVSGNILTDNVEGVFLTGFDNIIMSNTIIRNYNYGINVEVEGNKIYHNNFISNADQAGVYTPESYMNVWDDRYPSAGNYWSNYDGVDEKSGLYQNATGSDGIGDTPYVIDADNQDNYPLTSPYWYWSNPIPGDINRDTKVDWKDLLTLALTYGSIEGEGGVYNPTADLDESGDIDWKDLLILAQNYGRSV